MLAHCALYDPIGFLAPLKVYGAYICRRALIESSGDPLKEITGETRKLFLQYIFQVKKMEEVTFARNMSSLKRSETDVLIMCTDAGHNASTVPPIKISLCYNIPVGGMLNA